MEKGSQIEATIKSLYQTIDSASTNREKAVRAIQAVAQKIQEGQLGLIATLHHQEKFKKLLEAAVKLDPLPDNKVLQKICAFAKPFLEGLNAYKAIYQVLKSKKGFEEYKIEKISHHYFQRKESIQKLLQITNRQAQPFEKAKILNQYIEDELVPLTQNSEWDECLLTWMRIHTEATLQQIYQSAKIQVKTLCCRLHFKAQEKIVADISHQSFELSREDKTSKANLRRNMVGFLNCVEGSNSSGGFHYYGISHSSKEEKADIHGIPYTAQLRKEVLQDVRQTIKQIQPIQNVDEDSTPAQEEKVIKEFDQKVNQLMGKTPKEVKQNYQLTTLIEVDFIPIYNPNTLLYARNHLGLSLVLPRVKVFTGDPFDVYFSVTDRDIPEPFYRKDKTEQKLNVQQFYDELYRKLKKRADENITDKYGEMKFHPLCRFKGKK